MVTMQCAGYEAAYLKKGSNLGPTPPSYPVVPMRLQLEEGWGANGKRMKAVFNLET